MIDEKAGKLLQTSSPPHDPEENPSAFINVGVRNRLPDLSLVLGATGLTLLLYYVPHQEAAYERILHIVTTLRYGRLLRNLHFLAANVLLIAGICIWPESFSWEAIKAAG